MLKKLIPLLLASACANALAATDFYVVVPVPGRVGPAQNISVTLATSALPQGLEGSVYAGFDFKQALQVTGDTSFDAALATWAVTSGVLPAGLSLNPSTGVLAGTPTAAGTSSFTVQATYRTKTGVRNYQVVVERLAVTLAPSAGYSASFGNVFVNGSVTQRFTYANTGTVALSEVAGQVTGSPYATLSATTCGATLAAAASCTFDVTYHPTAADSLAAQLTVSTAQKVSAALALTGQSSNSLYSAGTPADPVFISKNAGVNGTFLGTQTSTTTVPQITSAYIGGTAFNLNLPALAQQISLQSSTATTATYVLGSRDLSATPYYTKMVQVVITLSGAQAYATVSGARYTSTVLTTGASSNILTLWSSGTVQTISTGGAGYGVAGLTVQGF